MQIVIDIDECIIERAKNNLPMYPSIVDGITKAIANGTPLPEHHGRIVDIGKIDEDKVEQYNPIIYLTVNGEYTEAISLDYLNDLPTIIEGSDSK